MRAGKPEMPKFKITVADDQGHLLYDEWIAALGPMDACAKAIVDSQTADVADSEEGAEPIMFPARASGTPTG